MGYIYLTIKITLGKGKEIKELISLVFGLCFLETGWSKFNTVDICIISNEQKFKKATSKYSHTEVVKLIQPSQPKLKHVNSVYLSVHLCTVIVTRVFVFSRNIQLIAP